MARKRRASTTSFRQNAKRGKTAQAYDRHGKSSDTGQSDSQTLSAKSGGDPKREEPPRNSLLRLPTEIRIRIYKYIFPNKCVPAVWSVNEGNKLIHHKLRRDGQKCSLAILSTSKCIYNEACDVLYGSVPYEVQIDGKHIFACLSSNKGFPFLIEPNTRSFHVASYKPRTMHLQASMLSYVRHIKLKLVECPRREEIVRWKINDTDFDEHFAFYHIGSTIAKVIKMLQDAPKLEQLTIKVELCPGSSSWRDHGANMPLRSIIPAVLRGLKDGRNFKAVTCEDIKTPDIPNDRYLTSYVSNYYVQLEEDCKSTLNPAMRQVAARMMSDAPVDPVDTRFQDAPALEDFVRQFKGNSYCVTMMRTLQLAYNHVINSNRLEYDVCRTRILNIWIKDKDRIATLLDAIYEPLMIIDPDGGEVNGAHMDLDREYLSDADEMDEDGDASEGNGVPQTESKRLSRDSSGGWVRD